MNDNDGSKPIAFIELSPVQAALFRHQYELDREEAGPKLAIDTLLYRGVALESRFSVAAEFEEMRVIVDALPDLVRARLESIWCDSRAQADYTVTVAKGRWAEGLEWEVRDAVMAAGRGFNGLSVLGDDHHVAFDPDWAYDDPDYEADEPECED